MAHTTEQKGFVDVFQEAISQIERDAKAAGSNMTEVCREAEISRTTPDRWRAKAPATIALVAKLQGIVAQKAAAAAQQATPE